jgi:hypothetical protein
VKSRLFVGCLVGLPLLITCTLPVRAQINVPNLPNLSNGSGIPNLSNLPGVSDITGLINQVNQLIASINSGAFMKTALDSVLSQYFDPLKQQIAGVIGELGLPDPAKSQQSLNAGLKSLPTTFNDAGFTNSLMTKGTVTSALTQATVNNVLGLDGQARLNQFLQTLVASSSKLSGLSTSSTAAAQSSTQFGSATQQLASTSTNSANTAQTTSEQTKNLAQQAQSLTSTQDVLKAIANQNANNSAILSSISSQFGNNASQNANLSNQLATLANQNSLISQQTVQQSVIEGQNLQLQLMQTEQGAAALANLDEVNSTLKSQSMSQALEFRSVIRSRMPLTLSK